MDDHIFFNLDHFCETNKYNEVGYLLLIAPNKMSIAKDELKASNSLLKHHINDLKFSMSSLKKVFISCNCRVEIAKTPI